ncbi:SusD/RagB family nutrient-binding outer membrane lipoprotein [Flavobacterium silvaticum]|uniref:SusD/RagB family nutrient-binding outer membrane lipoprotein n=1 Tax=Flavobacterium silvaticum TaxID=1852020 RepID=A0A972FPS0_9FLAO|nr:SusD/RagB family nutrient-binding outer membrane lipoprotein [Flavobacterium silvaticum]NMH29597.1 SusD/RagB family nutrient-binding outer membrane lipoprotein [Flavobacterium silvaticum]
MKKILYSAFAASLLFASCEFNEGDNDNQDAFYEVPPETLLTNAEKQLADIVSTPSVNLNPMRYFDHYWAQTTYNTESRFSFASRLVTDNFWNELFRDVLGNLQSSKEYIETQEAPDEIDPAAWEIQRTNKLAIIDILQVYAFQVLVDTYGDIPYTEALNPQDKLPAYDNDSDIYPQLIERLNADIAAFDDSQPSFATGEYIYEGDIASWIKFANSLKLKLGLNLSDVNPALAQSTIESAVTGGVIQANSENAAFRYPASAPNYSALYNELVASGRIDFVADGVFLTALEEKEDPRLNVYFAPNGDGDFVGGVLGALNTPTSEFAQIGDVLKEPDLPAQLIEATEISFYLAEAAARGFSVGNSDEFYYNQAITQSFEFWGVSGADTYLARTDVAYATADGDFKQKIGMQMWYAFFNRPSEAWNSYRRLDYPQLEAPSNASTAADGEIPKRLYYPINEQTVNTDNYQAAVEAIGGIDRMRIHVFWDVVTD